MWLFWGFVAPTPPIPGVSQSSLLVDKHIETNNVCLVKFYGFYEKLKNDNKMVTSCSIRRVGRRLSVPLTC